MTTTGTQDRFADVGQTLADLLCLPVADQPRESRRGWMSDRLIRGVTELVDTSGILDLLATWREEDDPERATKGGRPSLAEERTCLIILLALTIAGEHPLVVRVAEAYSSRLQTASRDLLNLPRANPTPQEVSDTALYHRVYRALHRILSVIDPYPGPRRGRITRAEFDALQRTWDDAEVDKKQQRLVTVTNALLQASIDVLPDSIRRNWTGNICVDATLVKTWGKAGSPTVRKNQDCSQDRMSPEYLAGWYTRTDDHREPDTPARGTRGRGKYAWGYEAHLGVMTTNTPDTTPDFPLLVLGMSLDKPAGRVGENATTVLTSIIERGNPAGICASDRAYFPNAKPEKFQLPARALGYRLCGDYRDDQLGVQAEHGGALLVEGNWYCPSIPQPLIDATADHRNRRIDDDVYADRIRQRARYLFRPKQTTTPTGNTPHMCPARGPGATATCPLVPASGPVPLGLPTTRTRIVTPPADPDVCCTNTTSITFPNAPHPAVSPAPTAAAKYGQDLQYKSPQWQAMFSTLRNTIEGFNAFTKSVTDEALELAGRRRVRGYAWQAVLVACMITASNLRKIKTFLLKRDQPATPDSTPAAKPDGRRGPDLQQYRPDPNAPPLAKPA